MSALHPSLSVRAASVARSARATRFAQRVRVVLVAHGALASFALAATARAQATPASARHLSLGDVVRLAAERNAGLDVARARLAQANARIRQRRADLYPTISASAVEAGRTFNTATLGFAFKGADGASFFDPDGEVLGPVITTDIRARITQSIFDPGARSRVKDARTAASATGTEFDVAAEQAAGIAATGYIRLLRADAQVAARRADSTLAAELLSIAQDQLSAGVGVALDVTRARSQLSQVRAQQVAARLERERATLDLARVLSLAPGETISASDSLAGLALTTDGFADASRIERAVARRPDIRALDAQLTVASERERTIRRESLPTLSAFGDRGPTAGNGTPFLSTYNWGVQLSVPIFSGFRTQGRLEEQAAMRQELEVRRLDLARQVALDVRGAREDLAAARDQLDAANDRVALAEQELAQARDRFRAGVAGNADVVTASLSLNGARTLVIDALTAWHLARVSLARAEGDARSLR
ncbi:MAG: TolC family protein [Gemmatimonadaceae bacterium]|nr:TolC family protein [Gemmatimonadaceae bacterium]